jgi:hypothetical protein
MRISILIVVCLAVFVSAQQQAVVEQPSPTTSKPVQVTSVSAKEAIRRGARVFIAPMNGYETYLTAGIIKKEVPLVIVNSREKADYEISGLSESQQASWAKMFFMGSQASAEQASIVMRNTQTGDVVWGYNVNKSNSFKGKQSSAEACAKHLKARIEGRE